MTTIPTDFAEVTPHTFVDATWPGILPLYDELAARPLDAADAPVMDAWLADWHAADTALIEARLLAEVAAASDTADPAKDAAHRRLSGEIGPRHHQQVVRLSRKLIEAGYTRPDLEMAVKRFRTDQEIFREENIPIEEELHALNGRFGKLTGGMTVEWEGREIPVPQLGPFLLHPDRSVRERAWRLQFQPYMQHRDEIADIFDAQLEKRQRLARNAGFANFRDYMFAALHRYDYTPADCETFHASVEQTFMPASARRHERRKALLGLESLRPWDLAPDPLGRPALMPYAAIDDLNATSESIFARVDPAFGDYFSTMRREGLLDLDSRPGKRPGGFCNTYPHRQRPFIFMNASGTSNDVQILMHEAGHAFHGFAAAHLPFVHAWDPGEEMDEVASMSMELLTAPYLAEAEGGFYNADEHRRARIEQLDALLTRFSWIPTVDAFQQWLYTDPAAADRDARDAKFVELWERFEPGLAWSGLKAERTARWYRQLHIFLYPFYYIEYAIAQLGALQVWRNSLRDEAKAIADYRAALALGGTRPLPELYATAGARLIFDAEGMAGLVTLIETELADLEGATT